MSVEPDTSGGGGILRRLSNLEAGQEAQTREIEELRKTVYQAGYRIGMAIIVASLTFAFSVLKFVA